MISSNNLNKSNDIELLLHDFQLSVHRMIEIDLDPHTFPQLKHYLREKLTESMKMILNHFFQEENKKFLNKQKEVKQTKAVFELETNQIHIENQKKEMDSLPTPSKKDLENFHQFFQTLCCKNHKCT